MRLKIGSSAAPPMHDIVAAYATTETTGIQPASSSMAPELRRPQRWSGGRPSKSRPFIQLQRDRRLICNSCFSECIAAVSVLSQRSSMINCIRSVASVGSYIANLCGLRVCSVLRWLVRTALTFEFVRARTWCLRNKCGLQVGSAIR